MIFPSLGKPHAKPLRRKDFYLLFFARVVHDAFDPVFINSSPKSISDLPPPLFPLVSKPLGVSVASVNGFVYYESEFLPLRFVLPCF